MSEGSSGRLPLIILFLAAAVVLAVIGVIYLTVNAGDVPGFLGGVDYETDSKYTKRAVAAFGLAGLALVGAYLVSGLRSRLVKKT
jgi:amino acid permease